jgi:predicted acetyltransferase
MNPEDYKLIPLDEIAADPVLKASYIEMMRRLHKEYWPDREDEDYGTKKKHGRYVYAGVLGSAFADFEELEYGFRNYLDYVHARGRWSPKETSCFSSALMGLVDTKRQAVVGEAGFYIKGEPGAFACEGYDVIDPSHRKQGLGKLIMALRLELAAAAFQAKKMIFYIDNDNEASLRRVWRLKSAGLVTASYPKSTGKDYVIRLHPAHSADFYLKILNGSKTPEHEYAMAGP